MDGAFCPCARGQLTNLKGLVTQIQGHVGQKDEGKNTPICSKGLKENINSYGNPECVQVLYEVLYLHC